MGRTRILGVPGAGKTETLLELVQAALEDGTDPSAIGFVSFSRAAVTTARERAQTRFALDAAALPWFRTVHSVCYRLLGLRRGKLVTEAQLRAFGESSRYRFAVMDDQDVEHYELRPRPQDHDGDQLLAFYDWCRQTCQTDRTAALRRRNRVDLDALGSAALVERFIAAYESWKQSLGLLDFTDLLVRADEAGLSPPLTVLIADEQQDTTPLQARLIERWAGSVREFIAAGDPNQAIYGWAGADGRFLRDLPADLQIRLTASYRLPRAVGRTADQVLARARTAVRLPWTARDAEGSVRQGESLSTLPLASGDTWFVLARNRYLMPRLAADMQAQGVPFLNRGGVSAFERPDELAAVVAALTLGAGGWVSVRQAAAALQRIIPQKVARGALWLPGAVVSLRRMADDYEEAHVDLGRLPGATDLLVSMLSDREGRWACMGKVKSHARLAAIRAVEHRHGLTGLQAPPRVTLSTIHGVKGLEAQHVALCPDMSKASFRGQDADPDGETRVWYTAVTRASESVHVLAPRGPRAYFALGRSS